MPNEVFFVLSGREVDVWFFFALIGISARWHACWNEMEKIMLIKTKRVVVA